MVASGDSGWLDGPVRARLLDAQSDGAFDRITRLTRLSLQADVCLVTLIEGEHQFFRSQSGLDMRDEAFRRVPLTQPFCRYVVDSVAPVVINDTGGEVRFKDHGAVKDFKFAAYLGVPIRAPHGAVIGSLCVVQKTPRVWTDNDIAVVKDFSEIVNSAIAEITGRTDAEARLRKVEILAHEYNHRAKNFIAIARALVNLSAREAKTKSELVEMISSRLSAYALAHAAIERSRHQLDLKDLAAELLQPYQSEVTPIVVDGVSVVLDDTQVAPVCLILHELATNSAKYGAIRQLSAPRLEWEAADGRIDVAWTEMANQTAETGDGTGFGDKLLDLSARQLGGVFKRQWGDDKMTATFSLKVDGRQGQSANEASIGVH